MYKILLTFSVYFSIAYNLNSHRYKITRDQYREAEQILAKIPKGVQPHNLDTLHGQLVWDGITTIERDLHKYNQHRHEVRVFWNSIFCILTIASLTFSAMIKRQRLT